jgi:hypothetical protein
LSLLALAIAGAIGLFVGAAVGGNTAMGYEKGADIGFFGSIGVAAVAVVCWWARR